MTHSKIQKMKFFVFLFIFLFAHIAICDGTVRRNDPAEVKKLHQTSETELNKSNSEKNPKLVPENTKNSTANKGETKNSETLLPSENVDDHPGFNSAALLRGFYVFLCLGILVIAYIVFRTFRSHGCPCSRLNRSRTQMIRKYGVLTNRQDVEMRPLPLDEDDEDDTTIFDARNVPVHGQMEHQSATA